MKKNKIIRWKRNDKNKKKIDDMKILISCLNLNNIAGSELYHYELCRELKLLGNDITLLTIRTIDPNFELRIKLNEIGVKQVDLSTLNNKEQYDIIVASQPQSNYYLTNHYQTNSPIVSIIHSEIRSEDPILHSRIKHYISIRESISKLLTQDYRIPENKISLIYNPIDQSRYCLDNTQKYEKYTGIFVGEVLDNIRTQAVDHLVESCIENDWNLLLMSQSKKDYNHPNIKYIPKTLYTENEVKKCHFTAGILMGRTTLEGWSCGLSGYMYNIDQEGNILSIETQKPKDIVKLCNSRYVAEQHLSLYKQLTLS